jgi:hypothetical protein
MSDNYWQCIGCGSIHIKEDKSSVGLFLELGLDVVGGLTCTSCGIRHEAADVFSGKLDPNQTDEELKELLAHPEDAIYDSTTRKWTKRQVSNSERCPRVHQDVELLNACIRRDSIAVKEALARGANVNCEDKMEPGSCPLLHAVFPKGSLAVVKILLAHGANPNVSNGTNTALMLAARDGSMEIVQALLTAGADLNATNRGGDSALTWTESSGHSELSKFLHELMNTHISKSRWWHFWHKIK